MNVEFAAEFFHIVILDVAKDVGECIAEIAWFQMLRQATLLGCYVLTVQEELFCRSPLLNTAGFLVI
jgi:hypothetical protein